MTPSRRYCSKGNSFLYSTMLTCPQGSHVGQIPLATSGAIQGINPRCLCPLALCTGPPNLGGACPLKSLWAHTQFKAAFNGTGGKTWCWQSIAKQTLSIRCYTPKEADIRHAGIRRSANLLRWGTTLGRRERLCLQQGVSMPCPQSGLQDQAHNVYTRGWAIGQQRCLCVAPNSESHAPGRGLHTHRVVAAD